MDITIRQNNPSGFLACSEEKPKNSFSVLLQILLAFQANTLDQGFIEILCTSAKAVISD